MLCLHCFASVPSLLQLEGDRLLSSLSRATDDDRFSVMAALLAYFELRRMASILACERCLILFSLLCFLLEAVWLVMEACECSVLDVIHK